MKNFETDCYIQSCSILKYIFLVVLGRATNDFLNQNSKDIIDEVMPAIEQVTSTLIDDICNKAFKLTPFDKLTPK